MNLSRLQTIQQKERQKSELQHLDDSFYRDVREFIDSLREERAQVAETVDDPFASREVRELTDAIETAEETVTGVYERRLGKVVKQASFTAAGLPGDCDEATSEEIELFEEIVADIEANRDSVLGIINGDTEIPSDDTETGETDTEPETRSPADEPPTTESPRAETADTGTESRPDEPDIPRTTVRIMTDVGEIFGVDERDYELAEEDVVTLPEKNADVLVEKDAAKPL